MCCTEIAYSKKGEEKTRLNFTEKNGLVNHFMEYALFSSFCYFILCEQRCDFHLRSLALETSVENDLKAAIKKDSASESKPVCYCV